MHAGAAISGCLRRRQPAALLAGAALVAAILPGALSSAAGANPVSANIDPALGHLRGTVGVIVQTGGQSAHTAERATVRLGGTITQDLPIVHGFAAKLPAHAVTSLAHAR